MKRIALFGIAAIMLGVVITRSGWTQQPRPKSPNATPAPAKAATPKVLQDASERPDPKTLVAFMRLKLDHTQKIVEGLALEDFDLISKHAKEIGMLSKHEKWRVYQTPEYGIYSADFQRITDSLVKAADDENLDGAALAYVEMILSCVKCHKYTRNIRLASAK